MNLRHVPSSLLSRPLMFQLRRDARELTAGHKHRQIPDEFPQFNLLPRRRRRRLRGSPKSFYSLMATHADTHGSAGRPWGGRAPAN